MSSTNEPQGFIFGHINSLISTLYEEKKKKSPTKKKPEKQCMKKLFFFFFSFSSEEKEFMTVWEINNPGM